MTTTNTESVNKINQKDLVFGERVAHVIEEKGLSKAWIADRLGVSKQALNYLLKHSIKPKFIDELAELLQVKPQWLETGKGQPSITNKQNTARNSTGIPIKTKLELLNGKNIYNDDGESIDFSHGNREAFIAYKLIDDSNFPPFIKGSILIFDIRRQPSNDDYVLIVIGEEVYVRQYLIDGTDICYKAGHDSHRTFINSKATLLGVLVEARYQTHQLP